MPHAPLIQEGEEEEGEEEEEEEGEEGQKRFLTEEETSVLNCLKAVRLDQAKAPQLRQWCERARVDSAGTRAAMIQRLNSHFFWSMGNAGKGCVPCP